MRIVFRSAADAVQHLAVSGHGLDQILSKSVLHNKNTPKIECEKFQFCRRERCAAQPGMAVLYHWNSLFVRREIDL